MNRFFSTLAVLAMALLAIAVSIRQTFTVADSFSEAVAFSMFGILAAFAVGILVMGIWLVKNELIRRKVSLRRWRLEVVQPLRRLLSTVWS